MSTDEIGFVPDIYTVLRDVPQDDSLPGGLYVHLALPKEAEVPDELGMLFGAILPAYSHRRTSLWWHALQMPDESVREQLHSMRINYLCNSHGAPILWNQFIRGARIEVGALRSIAYFLAKARDWILHIHKETGNKQTHVLSPDSTYSLCQAMEHARQQLIAHRALYDVLFQVIDGSESDPWRIIMLFKPTASIDYLQVAMNSRGAMVDAYDGAHIREVAGWLYSTPPIA